MKALIQAKLSNLIDNSLPNDQLQKVDDEKALQIVFALYDDHINFLSNEIQRMIEENTELKMKDFDEHFQRMAEGQLEDEDHTLKQTSSKNYKVLSDKLFEKEKKIESLSEEIEKLKKQGQREKQNIKQLKEEAENIKTLAQKQIIQQIINLENNETKKYQNKLIQEKQQLQKIMKQKENKLKYLIDNVNEILCINLQGSDNTEQWVQKFRIQAQKYKKEVSDYLSISDVKNDESEISKFAKLQKQKISSRRLYLLKNVIKQC